MKRRSATHHVFSRRLVVSCITGLMLGHAAVPAVAADLVEVYGLAVRYDPRIHTAEAQRNAALENKPQAIAKLLPRIWADTGMMRGNAFVGGSAYTRNGNAGDQDRGFWSSDGTIRFNQAVYRHDLWAQLAQADDVIAEAEASYTAEQQNLMLRTSAAYFNVLYNMASLRFAEAEQESIGRELEQAKARYDVGIVAITDVDEAQAAHDRARAGVIVATNDLNDAKEALRQIVGDDPGDLETLKADVPMQPPNPEDLDKWNDIAQQSNLTIIAANNRAEKVRKDIDIQFSGHFPTIDIVADSGFTDRAQPPYPFRSQLLEVGMRINIPIFEGGGVNSRIKQARYTFEAATQQLDEQRRMVRTKVKDAYRAVMSAIGQVGAFKAAIRSSESALEATIAGMEVGTRTMVDVLYVQRQYYQNKRDFAKALQNYIVNNLALKEAAGIITAEDIEHVNSWTATAPADRKKKGKASASADIPNDFDDGLIPPLTPAPALPGSATQHR